MIRRSTLGRCAKVCLLGNLLACSSSDPGSALGVGGSSNGGFIGSNGGSATNGGAQHSSGTVIGGSMNQGGGSPFGGAAPAGGDASNGGASIGGSSATVGGKASGGTLSSMGGAQSGGTNASGGAIKGGATSGGTQASGGASKVGVGGNTGRGGAAAGGASAAGGAASGGGVNGGAPAGGSTGSDRCDVGVYNASSPPKTLTLSGDLGTHDPVAIESNGTFYLFSTGINAKTSTDMVTWRGAPRPFSAPPWLTTAVPGVGDLWAPDISYFDGQYHLYYSGSTFGKNRSCIGHATKASLSSGSWTDQGSATICSNVGTSDNWNAIDPNVVIDTAGKPWLTFGSFWSGIKIIPLTASGQRDGTTVTSLANHSGGIEAPFMVRRCGYYYLFVSWDACCKGADSTYNIRVGRGTSVSGPFVDKAGVQMMNGGGTLMTQGGGDWRGPGHEGVVFTGTKAYLIYHAYAASNGASFLRVSELVWDADGWPVPVGP